MSDNCKVCEQPVDCEDCGKRLCITLSSQLCKINKFFIQVDNDVYCSTCWTIRGEEI